RHLGKRWSYTPTLFTVTSLPLDIHRKTGHSEESGGVAPPLTEMPGDGEAIAAPEALVLIARVVSVHVHDEVPRRDTGCDGSTVLRRPDVPRTVETPTVVESPASVLSLHQNGPQRHFPDTSRSPLNRGLLGRCGGGSFNPSKVH